MDIVLFVLLGLFGALVFFAWSCGRSYFEKGMIRGIEEAVRELRVGMAPQLGEEPPPDVQKALATLHNSLACSYGGRGKNSIHPHLWVLGASMAEECWVKGHGAGVRRKAPEEGRIRIDLSAAELLQLGGLANLGFQYMMPNMRIIDARRFTDSNDALDASRSISRLEAVIPKQYRPDLLRQAESRECLIDGWWRPVARKASA